MASAPFRMIVPDLLGFGRSPWPVVDYSVEDHIEALRRTVGPQLEDQQTIIVGHSMGAILAVEYARRHPGEVKGLILLNPPIFESEAEARKQIHEMSSMAAAFSLNRVLARASCDVLCAARPLFWHLAPSLERDVPAEVARHAVLHRWESFDGSLRRVVLTARLGQAVQSIEGTPVVFIPGNDDPVTETERVRNVAAAIDAGVQVVPGGHNILLEHPAETARLVQEAIAALSATNG
jgi:pimeloyl-ACP methyl ester carboxylesterase